MSEEIIIVPDRPCIGFVKRYKHRLELLGVKIIFPPRAFIRHDKMLVEFAVKCNAYILTTDKDFYHYYKKVIRLPQGIEFEKPKRWYYEEWWTILCREINKIRKQTSNEEKLLNKC